ncbi:MAG TPA: hypothetical protein VGK31_11920 [Thermoanaerobaculia bacterium]
MKAEGRRQRAEGRAEFCSLPSSFCFLLSAFCLLPSALPQCDYRFQYSGAYRASIFDVFVDNNDLWTATGYGVQLYDRSIDPPRLVAAVGIAGLTRVVRGANGIAYAAGTSGIAVVRRSGRSLQLVRTIDIGTVNDLLLRPTSLYAATPAGVAQFDLLDPLNPSRTAATFATTSAAVTSLAATGSTLYVADGDATIDMFSIAVPSSPQKLGTIATLARASSVETIGSRLYVSDGIRTEVFTSTGATMTSAGILAWPSTSIADAGSNVVVVAGGDRQIRAFDAGVPANAVELFEAEVLPNGGTVNRVSAMQIAGGRLYVAGGDTGLTTYDVSRFIAPFPVRAYAIGSTDSVVALSNAFYAARSSGGIQEMNRSSSGGLVLARQWDTTELSIVQDGAPGLLLTSSGATLTFWTLNATLPVPISSATFRAAVHTAVLSGAIATVLLDDGTLWAADMSQVSPAPVRVASSVGSLSQLARSDRGIAATEVSSDGNTTIHYWSGNDLNAMPVNASIAGASTTLALSGATAAVFTFRGITLVDFGASSQTLLPGSNTAVVRTIDIAGGKLIALTQQSTLRIWNVATGALEKEFFVPGDAVALDAAQESTVAAVATSSGVASINYATSTSLPSLIANTVGNAYYKKAVAGHTRLYLFDGRIVEIYDVVSTPAPRYIASVFAPGAIDIAASDSALFALSSSGVVTQFSTEGVQVRSKPLDEGSDIVPLSISAIAGVPWISFSRGCATTGCEKRTVVLDPQSLVRTASLTGGIVDVTTSGSRAYGIFDLPVEIRVYDVRDPLHPAALATRVNDAGAVAIAYNNGTVYALADKAYAYSETSLTRTGEQLTAAPPATTADVLIDGGCATIIGRSAAAESYVIPQWSPASAMNVPGTIRSLTLSSGRLVLLTDYSIEIWSRAAAPKPAKRKAVGP